MPGRGGTVRRGRQCGVVGVRVLRRVGLGRSRAVVGCPPRDPSWSTFDCPRRGLGAQGLRGRGRTVRVAPSGGAFGCPGGSVGRGGLAKGGVVRRGRLGGAVRVPGSRRVGPGRARGVVGRSPGCPARGVFGGQRRGLGLGGPRRRGPAGLVWSLWRAVGRPGGLLGARGRRGRGRGRTVRAGSSRGVVAGPRGRRGPALRRGASGGALVLRGPRGREFDVRSDPQRVEVLRGRCLRRAGVAEGLCGAVGAGAGRGVVRLSGRAALRARVAVRLFHAFLPPLANSRDYPDLLHSVGGQLPE